MKTLDKFTVKEESHSNSASILDQITSRNNKLYHTLWNESSQTMTQLKDYDQEGNGKRHIASRYHALNAALKQCIK